MFQACDWLVRKTDEFARSVVALKEVRNLKFAGMVRPGQLLVIGAKTKKLDSQCGTFVAEARVDDAVVASGRIVVERYNLADRYPTRATTDRYLRKNGILSGSSLPSMPARQSIMEIKASVLCRCSQS